MARYLRLLRALARYSLARELAFRGNFLVKISVEVLWLGILLVFYRAIFSRTSVVAGWSEAQYLFFVGCYFALESIMEMLFLENCNGFAELVRTGELDFVLVKPIDEQFLISFRTFEWSSAPSLIMGTSVMIFALVQMGQPIDPLRVLVFLVMFASGVALAYSFLLLLTSTSVWLVRNQSLYELWWLFASLMRYPREIFTGTWAAPVGWFFTFVVPIMLVINVPAGVMVRLLNDPMVIGFALLVTAGMLFLSRSFLRFSLRRYRSASS